MIKVIAFDYGGVLGSDTDAWETNFKPMIDMLGLSADHAEAIQSKVWVKQKVGKSPEDEFFQALIDNSPNKPSLEKIKDIYYQGISINKSVLDIAKKLKNKGNKIIIFSNEAREFMDYKRKKFGLDKIFNKNYTSAYLGLSKPDNEIFEHVLTDLGIEPEELLFIDNSQRNLDVANQLGIRTILFQNPQILQEELANLL